MKMTRRMQTRSSLIGFAIGALSAVPAHAQTTPPADSNVDEVITLNPFTVNASDDKGYRAGNSVSATRVNTAIADLPFSVNAFTEEFIEDLHTNDLADVLKFAPNVANASADFSNGDLQFNVRGFSQFNPLRNGLSGPRTVGMSNISRVEVVKGPSSVLYGDVQPGGVINFITKKPMATPFYMLRQTVGTDAQYRTDVDATGPISKKQGVFYRINGTWDNYERSMKPSKTERWSFAPSLRLELFEKRMTINLDYEKYSSLETPPVFTLPNLQVYGYDTPSDVGTNTSLGNTTDGPYQAGLPDDFNFTTPKDWRRYETDNFVADATINLPWDLVFRGAGAYSTRDAAYMITGYGFVQANPVSDGNGELVREEDGTIKVESLNTSRRRVRYERNYGHNTDYTGELARDFKWKGGHWKALVGMSYSADMSGSVDRRTPTSQWSTPWNFFDQSTWNRDRPEYQINDLTNVVRDDTGNEARSLRRGFYNINQVSLMKNRVNTLFGVRRSELPERGLSQTSPLGGFLVRATREVSVYASYSESFVDAGPLVIDDVYGAEGKPIIGKGYEAGVKTDLFDGKFSSALTVFQLNNTNVVNSTYSFGSDASLHRTDVQSGEQRARGIELDATITLKNGWKAYLSYGYLDAKLIKDAARPWMVGSRLIDSSNHTGGLMTKYEFLDGPMKGVYVGGNVSYVGKKLQRQSSLARTPPSLVVNPDGSTTVTGGTGPAYSFYQDPYTTADLFIGYNWNSSGKVRYGASLYVRNITDQMYEPSNLSRGDGRRISFTLEVKY
jgi:iron complex outermembrane recepter protein